MIFKNAAVFLENRFEICDVAVENGKIAAIGTDLGSKRLGCLQIAIKQRNCIALLCHILCECGAKNAARTRNHTNLLFHEVFSTFRVFIVRRCFTLAKARTARRKYIEAHKLPLYQLSNYNINKISCKYICGKIYEKYPSDIDKCTPDLL